MIALFDSKDINKAAAAINPDKLLWLNRHYLKTLSPKIVAERLRRHIDELQIDVTHGPDLEEVVQVLCERCETLCEMAVKARMFFEPLHQYEKQATKHLTAEIVEPLNTAIHRFTELKVWTKENLHQTIEDIAKQFNLKLGKIAQPIRVAITGTTVSPPLDATLYLLGKQKVIERITDAIKLITKPI